MNTSAFVESPGRRTHRRHGAEFKAQVVLACRQPGVSIAAVALANGLNANMLRRWVLEAERVGPMAASGQGAVAMSATAVASGLPGCRADAEPACCVGAARHSHRAHARADDDRHALADTCNASWTLWKSAPPSSRLPPGMWWRGTEQLQPY